MLYRFALKFIILLIFTSYSFSQTLDIRVGIGYHFHIEGTKSNGYILPFFDRHYVPTNSINEFYNNSLSYNIGLTYSFNPQLTKIVTFGLDYERSVLESRFQEVDVILGKDLFINSFTPYVGFNKYLTSDEKTYLNYNIGVTLVYCSGYSEKEGIIFNHNYDTSILLRLGISAVFDELISKQIGLVIGVKGFIGFINRGQVDVSYNNEFTTLMPIGSNKLQDNSILTFINLQYKFGL